MEAIGCECPKNWSVQEDLSIIQVLVECNKKVYPNIPMVSIHIPINVF